MKNFKYIIIGGGLAGDAAVKGLREIDEVGTVLMVTKEPYPPYSRPPLTKGLWKNTPEEKIWKKTEEKNIEIMTGTGVTDINNNSSVTLDNGEVIYFEKLLIATGGIVSKLPVVDENIIYYRYFDDYKKLRMIAESNNNFAVIGGGFIGTEIAAALAMNGKKVTIFFPGRLLGEKVFPRSLAEFVTDYYRKRGVDIVNNESVIDIAETGGISVLKTGNGRTFTADAVIAGIGIKPDIELAKKAGITVSDGINTDNFLMTSIGDIYAAGDAANFYNPLLDKRIRVEHEDNAVKMGKQAGRNMAGANEEYSYLPFFYSDMFDLGYEAVGELNSAYEIVEDWKEKYKEGAVYYLDSGRVKGVLLWNVWKQLDEARKIIGDKNPQTAETLIGRLR